MTLTRFRWAGRAMAGQGKWDLGARWGFLGLQDVQGHNHPRQTEPSSELSSASAAAAPALARKFGMKKLHE